MIKRFLLPVFIFTIAHAVAQNYVVKEFEMRFPDNRNFEAIGEILVSGYLKGEILAYTEPYHYRVLKTKPIPYPRKPVWKKDEQYIIGDTVLFGDKYYEGIYADLQTVGLEPANNNEWIELPSNEPISRGYLFPTIKDTLAKSEFLQRMVASDEQTFDEWAKNYTAYYVGDVVSYKGINYECIADNDSTSPENKEYWLPTSMGSKVYFFPSELSEISILFHYTIQNRDTVWNPQMVTLYINRNVHPFGVAVPVMHFYYRDVLAYVQKRYSPVFNGAGKYIFSPSSPQSQSSRKVITPEMTARITDSKSPLNYTFPEAITKHQFLCCSRPASIDSVAPAFDNTIAKPVAPTRYLFFEKHTAPADSIHHTIVRDALPELWQLLSEQYESRTQGQSNLMIKFYPWTYDLHKVRQTPVALSVVYKKELTGKQWSFTPYQLFISYSTALTRETGINEEFGVYWNDLAPLLKTNKSKMIKKLVNAIELGELEFTESEIVYGLMGQ